MEWNCCVSDSCEGFTTHKRICYLNICFRFSHYKRGNYADSGGDAVTRCNRKHAWPVRPPKQRGRYQTPRIGHIWRPVTPRGTKQDLYQPRLQARFCIRRFPAALLTMQPLSRSIEFLPLFSVFIQGHSVLVHFCYLPLFVMATQCGDVR